ncbi:hypothetical protein O3P69_010412 [Scylla paramamosain]|uniref:Uncharacterized protein n=1 Tax=Scylla paramamosain TaxID=85552 RepID=A0AAW0TVR9_SCYPA
MRGGEADGRRGGREGQAGRQDRENSAASCFCAWVSVPSRPSRHVLWRQLAELLRFQRCSVAVFVINPLFPGDYVVLLGLTVLLRPLQLKFPACQTLWACSVASNELPSVLSLETPHL